MKKTVTKKESGMKNRMLGMQLQYFAMVFPGVLFIIVFNYLPMGGILMAFQKYVPAKGILGSKWVGLKHFIDLFSNMIFGKSLVIR